MQKITADLSGLKSPFGDGHPAQRVETGALQINDDWPGIFIRGDGALRYSFALSSILAQLEREPETIDFIARNSLKNLVDLLRSCAIVSSK